MKTVYFLRHAKSDWGSDAPSDHERPLAPRGVKAAAVVGRFLTAIDQAPDLVVTSSAVRARTTAELAQEAGAWNGETRIDPAFYGADATGILSAIRAQSDAVSRLLVVGHQPTWSETVGRLVGQAEIKMVTAALARVDLAVERWGDATFGRGVLSWMVTPKLIERGLGG